MILSEEILKEIGFQRLNFPKPCWSNGSITLYDDVHKDVDFKTLFDIFKTEYYNLGIEKGKTEKLKEIKKVLEL